EEDAKAAQRAKRHRVLCVSSASSALKRYFSPSDREFIGGSMTLLVKDANTSVQSLSTVVDGNGSLVPLHAPTATSAQGVARPVGPQNPLPVVNTAALAASDGSGTVA